MPDEQNTLTQDPNTAATPNSDATSTVMTDPQKLVDEALTPSMTTSSVTVSEPVEETEPTSTETTSETTPLAKSPTPPMMTTEFSAPTTDTTTTTTVSTETSAPTLDQAVTPSSTTEEVPLAFASSIPADMPKTETVTTTTNAGVPPVFVPPPTAGALPPSPEPVKKKGKMGKIIAGMLGFLLLAGGIFGGYWYYTNYMGESVQIAAIDLPQSSCSGCDPFGSGHLITWREGKCVQKAALCDSGGGGNTTAPIITGPNNVCYYDSDRSGGYTSGDQGYGFFCGGCVNGCVSTGALNASGGGCQYYINDKCGGSTSGGTQCTDDAATAAVKGWTKTCGGGGGVDSNGNDGSACGSIATVWFSTTGQCKNAANNGLCATYPGCKVASTVGGDGGSVGNGFECDSNGCRLTTGTLSGSCYVKRYTCKYDPKRDYSGGCQDSPSGSAASYTFTNQKCTVQQIDAMCNGKSNFVSKTNTECDTATAPPSTTTAPPTFKCDGITKNKTDAQIETGTVVQFTCAGSSTPAGAVALNYIYQVKKDAGAWTDIPTVAGKASYTVPGVGTYTARCKACGQITEGARSICNPDWESAWVPGTTQ